MDCDAGDHEWTCWMRTVVSEKGIEIESGRMSEKRCVSLGQFGLFVVRGEGFIRV